MVFQNRKEQLDQGRSSEPWSYLYTATSLKDALNALKGDSLDPGYALEGVTQVEGVSSAKLLQALPETLRSLSFRMTFNESLRAETFPRDLERMSFGHAFNQPLIAMDLAKNLSKLQSLTFGHSFNQSVADLCWPSSLQSLTSWLALTKAT